MKPYRILTNGNQYKAQIRMWVLFVPCWGTLQCFTEGLPPIADVVFNTYAEAAQAAIKQIAKTKKIDKGWRVAHFDRDFYNNVGLPEPDPALSDTM